MKNLIKRSITGFILGTIFWLVFVYCLPIYFSIMLVGILAQIIFFEWTRLFDIKKPLFWLLMPFYPVLPFVLLIMLNHAPEYRDLLFYLFIIVFSHDTGSYIVGSIIGKHKIFPHVSPGKTWEGFFGGYIAACIGLWFLLWEQEHIKTWAFVLSFTFIVCVLSLLGDLFESWLKRRADKKDSGFFLPGHGGFLDRFDGILFAVVFFYLLKDYLVTIFQTNII